VSYGDKQLHSFGISSRHAPWRRGARPLAVLFVLQFSGIGCAARAPELPEPTRPDEFSPYLTVYEEQLELAGITLEGAETYVAGRASSPLTNDGGTTNGTDATGEELLSLSAQGPGGQETFKVVDGIAEYRIGPGDILQLTTFLGPETPIPTSFRVLADGTINIARFNIGSVQAAGTTPSELTRILTDLYRRYVPSGYAEARVEEYTAWHATLSGEIAESAEGGPGNYVLDGRTTVTDFIYAYGGPSASADLGDVRILRAGVQQRVDVAGVLAGTADDPTLRSGDIVLIPSIEQGSSRMFLFGEVASPGVYTFTEGITVLDAIAQAGGYTQNAKRTAVYVSRPSTAEVIPVNLDIMLGGGQTASAPLLEAGDFVVVPFAPNRSEAIRGWVGIFSLILSALTIIELVRR